MDRELRDKIEAGALAGVAGYTLANALSTRPCPAELRLAHSKRGDNMQILPCRSP